MTPITTSPFLVFPGSLKLIPTRAFMRQVMLVLPAPIHLQRLVLQKQMILSIFTQAEGRPSPGAQSQNRKAIDYMLYNSFFGRAQLIESYLTDTL